MYILVNAETRLGMKDLEDNSSAAKPSLVSQWIKIVIVIASYW